MCRSKLLLVALFGMVVPYALIATVLDRVNPIRWTADAQLIMAGSLIVCLISAVSPHPGLED